MEPINEEQSVRESMDSKFRYVLLVAQRAEQLMRGARSKLDLPGVKPTTVAKQEIDRSLVEWDYGPAPEPELEALPEETEGPEAAAEEGAETAEPAAEEEVH
jgi:DNA-directed RNA polymerase subunit K/omega